MTAKEERQLGALIGAVVGEASAHAGHAAPTDQRASTKLGKWVQKREAEDGGLVAYPTERLTGSRLTKAEEFQAGQTNCGDDCMTALAKRVAHPPSLPTATPGGSLAAKEAELGDAGDKPVDGAYDVGEERVQRAAAKEQSEEEKSTFIHAQEKRMDAEVQAGWTALGKHDSDAANAHLAQARHYHTALLRLLRGSAAFTQHLATPRAIKGLRDAIDAAASPADDGTPKRLAAILDSGSAPAADVVDDAGRGMPKKLAAIMARHYSGAGADGGRADLARIAEHFGAAAPAGADAVTLPPSKAPASPLGGAGFLHLAKRALADGKVEVGKGRLAAARRTESKARVYLLSVADAAKRGDARDAAALGGLQLQSSILGHAVDNLAAARARARQAQLNANLETLGAPIQKESLSDYATAPSARAATRARAAARLEADRVRFQAAVRAGERDAAADNIGDAQHRLVQARLYAQREGLLEREADIGAGDAANAAVAKRALKRLARSIVQAEQALAEGATAPRRPPSLKELGPGSREDRLAFGARGRGGGGGEQGEMGNRVGGRRSRVLKWEGGYSRIRRSDRGGERPGSAGSAARFASANGARYEERHDERRADRAESRDCNSLSCLFAKVNEDRARDGLGGSDALVLPGSGADLTRRDFGHARTDMHTGMHAGYRLKLKYHKAGGGTYHDPLRRVPHGGDVAAPDRGQGETDMTDTRNSRDRVGRAGRAAGRADADAPLPDVAGVSARVASADSRDEEAVELKHSMREAMSDYKALLAREVRKEEARQVSLPGLALAGPRGKAALPGLAGVGPNPAGVTLSALSHRKAAAAGPLPGQGQQAAGAPAAGGAGVPGLMRQLLRKASFRGGPWDAQEGSQDVRDAPERPLGPPGAPARVPARSAPARGSGGLGPYLAASRREEAREHTAAAVRADEARVEAARIAQQAGARATAAAAAPRRVSAAEAAALERQAGEVWAARRAYNREAAQRRALHERRQAYQRTKQDAAPLDMAGLLVHDISRDLGF